MMDKELPCSTHSEPNLDAGGAGLLPQRASLLTNISSRRAHLSGLIESRDGALARWNLQQFSSDCSTATGPCNNTMLRSGFRFAKVTDEFPRMSKTPKREACYSRHRVQIPCLVPDYPCTERAAKGCFLFRCHSAFSSLAPTLGMYR
jgi:hypothetical protein